MQDIALIEDWNAAHGTAGAIDDTGPASRRCDLRAVIAFGGVASLATDRRGCLDQTSTGIGRAELRAADGATLRRLPYGFPRTDAIRTPV
jgi:hypothetical protein